MRNKFSLILALSIIASSVFAADAQTNRNRNAKKSDQQARKKTSVVQRQNRVIVTAPKRVAIRPAVRSNVRPFVVRSFVAPQPLVVRTNVLRDESREYYENGRVFENDYISVAQVARLNGYRDGLREGGKDARDGDAYNPFAEHDYQDGATGYISKYRNRAAYQQYYRQSFIRGYREAFDRYLGGYDRRNW